MKYQPRGSWVIVNLLSKEKTAGGILLPQTAKEDRLARVEAVGEGQRYMDGTVHPMVNLKVGDVVVVQFPEHKIPPGRYLGVKANNQVLVSDDEVIAVVADYAEAGTIQA